MDSLIQKVMIGDKNAVAIFYKKYAPKISRFVKKKLQESDAQEIVNDTFLEAIDSLPKLKNHQHVNTWLYTIAHNKIADFYRKKKIKSLLISQIPFFENFTKEVNQPEFEHEKNRIRDKIEDTFKSVSKKYQNILKLHYEEGIPVKAIGDKLHLSFQATQSLLFRARQTFKKVYEKM